MDVLERRRRGADDHDLVAEEPARELVQVDAGERDRRHRPGRSREVDQPRVVGEGVHGLPGRPLDGGHCEGLQALPLIRRPADDSARVGVEVPVAEPRAGIGETLLAAQELPLALVVHLGRREDEVPRGTVLVHERVVLADARLALGGLAELDVVGDHLRARSFQVLDRLRVDLARERPALPEFAERRVVDLYDDDVLGRLLLAPYSEAAVDAAQLGAAEDVPAGAGRDQVAAVGEQRQPGRRHADGEEERDAQASAVGHALNSVREQRPRTSRSSSACRRVLPAREVREAPGQNEHADDEHDGPQGCRSHRSHGGRSPARGSERALHIGFEDLRAAPRTG